MLNSKIYNSLYKIIYQKSELVYVCVVSKQHFVGWRHGVELFFSKNQNISDPAVSVLIIQVWCFFNV